jgi:LysR family hydrogen peroxide-inducible transcriptional activator
MVSLKQLRYLAALKQHGHFGQAAAACGISQPALSMQIRELERSIGADLVERRPGGAILTDLGREIAERGEQLIVMARDLTEFARHHAAPLSGRLVLGVIPSLAPYVLPKVLPALQRDYPQLRLELRETLTRPLIEELNRGALDVALLALPIDEPELETKALFEDPFLLAVPAADPRPETKRVSADEIDPQRLILLEEGHCLRDQALAACRTQRAETAVGLGATSLTTVLQMVANGYGETLLPQVAVDVELRDERVKLLRLRPPQPGRRIGLVWRRSSPRKRDFLEIGAAIIAALGHGRPASSPRKKGAA